MIRVIFFWFLMMILHAVSSYAQSGNTLTFQQLDSLQQIEKKPVLVFIHTQWCRYCRAMEHTTFQNEEVQAWLDSAFYWVALDAEAQHNITIGGQTFGYQPTGPDAGQHELARVLGQIDGKLTFPTLCYLNADYEIIYQQTGFIRAEELVATLKVLSSTI
ncbi:MAG: thioredoxin family protein [Cyclobacteriaceae bacterium]